MFTGDSDKTQATRGDILTNQLRCLLYEIQYDVGAVGKLRD